ncbi:MAG: hypothetical protein ACLP7A_09280 [Desulfobaccales bacterium]
MKQLVAKLQSLEKKIAAERGNFSLFGLFLREEAENKWDLVVAAPWINADSFEHIKYIADNLKSYIKNSELLSISRIVLLDAHDPIVQNINRYCRVLRGGLLELNDFQFINIELPFKYAYIIISQNGGPVSVNVGKGKLRQTA